MIQKLLESFYYLLNSSSIKVQGRGIQDARRIRQKGQHASRLVGVVLINKLKAGILRILKDISIGTVTIRRYIFTHTQHQRLSGVRPHQTPKA